MEDLEKLLLLIVFLMCFPLMMISQLSMISAVEKTFPRLYIETDKEQYSLGESIRIHVFLDGSGIKCLCYKHSWTLEIRNASDNSLIRRWTWNATAREKTFYENHITWTPEHSGIYKVIVSLLEHGQRVVKTVKVSGSITSVKITTNILTKTFTKTVTTTILHTRTLIKGKKVAYTIYNLYVPILIMLAVIIVIETFIIMLKLRRLKS